MKLTQLFGALALAAGLLTAGAASAAQIVGGISFEGDFRSYAIDGVTLNENLLTARKIKLFDVKTTAPTGDFSGIIDGTSVSTPGTLDINPVGLPASAIWDVAGFSLVLDTLAEDGNAPTFLRLVGTGTIKKAGFSDTPGTWEATFQRAGTGINATFSFSASSANEVPEGGTALALLGVGLMGVEGARRRLKTAKA